MLVYLSSPFPLFEENKKRKRKLGNKFGDELCNATFFCLFLSFNGGPKSCDETIRNPLGSEEYSNLFILFISCLSFIKKTKTVYIKDLFKSKPAKFQQHCWIQANVCPSLKLRMVFRKK